MSKWLLAAASMMIVVPALGQDVAIPPAKSDKTVEGATPDRVAQIDRCKSHKFESVVEIDPATHRSTRVKLCANTGSSDAAWVKTLEAAIVQIEDRDMPAAAKDKLIAALKAEIAKFAPAAPSPPTQSAATLFGPGIDTSPLAPAERFETSILPSLTPKKTVPAAASGAGPKAAPRPRMAIRIKCLERGETGSGATCDFFVPGTILAVSAVEGLEKGATLRFLRRGETHGEAAIAPLAAGQSVRVKLPGDICKGISYSKVEIDLLAPDGSTSTAARIGPYGLRC